MSLTASLKISVPAKKEHQR